MINLPENGKEIYDFKAIVSYRLPRLRPDFPELNKSLLNGIAESIASLDCSISVDGDGLSKVKVSILDDVDDQFVIRLLNFKAAPIHDRVVVQFKVVLIFDPRNWSLLKYNGKDEVATTSRGNFFISCMQKLENHARRLLIAANLTWPDALDLEGGEITCADACGMKFGKMISCIDFLEHDNAAECLKLWNLISLQDAFDWYNSFSEVNGGVSESAVGRGLALFTHIYTDALFSLYNGFSYVLPVLALDSLFGKRNGDDLRKAINSFLGKNLDQDQFNRCVYVVRNSIIHGKEDLPIAFTTESDDIYDDDDSSKSTMQETAYLLLVEILQKLVREKVYTI